MDKKINEQIGKMKSLMGIEENTGNTQLYFHGGNLESFQDSDTQSKVGSIVYGIGLYLTTSRIIAEKYSKGSRKLYVLEVDDNIKDYNHVDIKKQVVIDVFRKYLSKQKHANLLKFLDRVNGFDVVNASNLNIFLLNENYVSRGNIKQISDFFKFQGVDGEIDYSPFGYQEKQLVLINFSKIKNITKIEKNDPNYYDDFKYKK